MGSVVNIPVSDGGSPEDKRGLHSKYRDKLDGKILNFINGFSIYEDNINHELRKQFTTGVDNDYPLQVTYYNPGFNSYWSASDGLSPLSGIVGAIGGCFNKDKVRDEVEMTYLRQEAEGYRLMGLKIPRND
jgi:hypothetical protein